MGATPAQWVAAILDEPPKWLLQWWFNPSLVILGIAILFGAFRFNLYDRKQIAIDEISEELSWAIHNLLNRPVKTEAEFMIWEIILEEWHDRVYRLLDNRAFFTRSDQIHFDRIGFVRLITKYNMACKINPRVHREHSRHLRHLDIKFERLRDIINWTQMRRR